MLLYLLACTTAPPTECQTGFTLEDDGLCYEEGDTQSDPVDTGDDPVDEPPTVDAVLAALPACEPTATDGRIDLYAGCADGVCPGISYDDAVGLLGEPDCYGLYYELDTYVGGSLYCAWPDGIELSFDDTDQDGAADPFAAAYGVSVNETFDGGTKSGLGIGANLSCFVDELGAPDSLSFESDGNSWLPDSAYWGQHGVSLRDSYGPGDTFGPDGEVDNITLYGSDVEF